MNEAVIFNLIQEATWHKECCTGECNVSLYLLGEAVVILRGGPLTAEEKKLFM